VLQCVAVCCSVLQCVAVCCSVLQCVAVCCSVLQCVPVCRSVLQCVAVCCSCIHRRVRIGVLHDAALCCTVLHHVAPCCTELQCVAAVLRLHALLLQCVVVCRSVLQPYTSPSTHRYVAAWYSVMQCVAVYCSAHAVAGCGSLPHQTSTLRCLAVVYA